MSTEQLVSDVSRDIVDNVWAKAKQFGRTELALEIEQIIQARETFEGALVDITAMIDREINRQSEISNRK